MSGIVVNRLEVGKRLKEARLNAGLSREQAAKIVGGVAIDCDKWESGATELKSSTMYRLSRRYGVPMEYFFVTSLYRYD